MTTTLDKEPRFRPFRGSTAKAFWHSCSICGNINAPFGKGVNLRRGEFGVWKCAAYASEAFKTGHTAQSNPKTATGSEK